MPWYSCFHWPILRLQKSSGLTHTFFVGSPITQQGAVLRMSIRYFWGSTGKNTVAMYVLLTSKMRGCLHIYSFTHSHTKAIDWRRWLTSEWTWFHLAYIGKVHRTFGPFPVDALHRLINYLNYFNWLLSVSTAHISFLQILLCNFSHKVLLVSFCNCR